jgi:hypothetical protein
MVIEKVRLTNGIIKGDANKKLHVAEVPIRML